MLFTSIITMSITMLSRILGLFRGTLVAYFFGSNMTTDAYYSAFKIANFFRQLLGEGALGNVFIPLYHKKVSLEGEKAGKEFIFSILNAIAIFAIIVALFMILFSKNIIAFMVVGFDAQTKELASSLLRIMSVYFIFISLAGMIGAILNNFGKFIISASTSIFFNIAIIVSALFFSKTYGIKALAYGVVLGGGLQFLVVFIPLLCILKKYSFKICFRDSYLKLLMTSLLPMLVGIFARQINTMVDQFFASFLSEGGITALENATRIYLLPIGVFAVTLSNIIFPSISKSSASKNYVKMQRQIVSGMNLISFFVIPSMLVLTLYSKEIISLIFSYGKFSKDNVYVTSQALLFYSLGLIFYALVHVISKAYYAFGDTKRPAKFAIFAIILNIILNASLIRPLAYRGLALSTAIASLFNFMLLFIYFRKKYLKLRMYKITIMTIRIVLVSLIAYFISSFIDAIVLKLIVFAIVYLAIFAIPLKRYRMDMFYK